MIRAALILCLGLSLLAGRAGAHALEPGFLDIAPFGAGEWRVTWRKPQVQGLPMDGVDPTYENISSFDYPGARPLYVYVKKAHMRAIPGLDLYLQEWVKNWEAGGPLSKIGLVASPAAEMAENRAKVDQLITMSRADLVGETAEPEAAE